MAASVSEANVRRANRKQEEMLLGLLSVLLERRVQAQQRLLKVNVPALLFRPDVGTVSPLAAQKNVVVFFHYHTF